MIQCLFNYQVDYVVRDVDFFDYVFVFGQFDDVGVVKCGVNYGVFVGVGRYVDVCFDFVVDLDWNFNFVIYQVFFIEGGEGGVGDCFGVVEVFLQFFCDVWSNWGD